MKFREAVRHVLSESPGGLTPQEIRDKIRDKYPSLFGTEAHIRNVNKGHYKDIDHAVLAQIYIVKNNARDIDADTSEKPMRLFLSQDFSALDAVDNEVEESLSSESLEKLEEGIGVLYVLGTNLFTKEGKEIVKIGITTGPVDHRINQLYNTSVPYKFRLISEFETKNYAELEQAMHKMFDPFRINRSREFFTEDCLPFTEALIDIHSKIGRDGD